MVNSVQFTIIFIYKTYNKIQYITLFLSHSVFLSSVNLIFFFFFSFKVIRFKKELLSSV